MMLPSAETSGLSPTVSDMMEAKYLPEGHLLTVTVLIFPSMGR